MQAGADATLCLPARALACLHVCPAAATICPLHLTCRMHAGAWRARAPTKPCPERTPAAFPLMDAQLWVVAAVEHRLLAGHRAAMRAGLAAAAVAGVLLAAFAAARTLWRRLRSAASSAGSPTGWPAPCDGAGAESRCLLAHAPQQQRPAGGAAAEARAAPLARAPALIFKLTRRTASKHRSTLDSAAWWGSRRPVPRASTLQSC